MALGAMPTIVLESVSAVSLLRFFFLTCGWCMPRASLHLNTPPEGAVLPAVAWLKGCMSCTCTLDAVVPLLELLRQVSVGGRNMLLALSSGWGWSRGALVVRRKV